LGFGGHICNQGATNRVNTVLRNLLARVFIAVVELLALAMSTAAATLVTAADAVLLMLYKARKNIDNYTKHSWNCSARDWDGKDYLRIIPRVVLVEDPRLT
jgi:hypothetical protein